MSSLSIDEINRLKEENKEAKEIIAELKAENEQLRTQYNCYACGNCKGKEDYINLERHHKGLRKQFDKKIQTLQEIKKIAENRTKTEDYLLGQEYTDLVDKILDLITKAEEE